MNPEEAFKQQQQLKVSVAQLAENNPQFREALLNDPKATIAELLGTNAAEMASLEIEVVVEQPGKMVFTIGADMSDTELDDELLDQVAGGSHWLTHMTSRGWPPKTTTNWSWGASQRTLSMEVKLK